MTDAQFATSFKSNGYHWAKSVLAPDTTQHIRAGIFEVMRPYLSEETVLLGSENGLDAGFHEISRLGGSLKSNCYKLWGKLAAIPMAMADPAIWRTIEALGFGNATVQSFSVFCLERGNNRNTFLPHQDLRDRTSLNSLLIWIPLSDGMDIGGMSILPKTHLGGPLHHDLSSEGKPFLPESLYPDAEVKEIVGYKVGDCIFMTPYLIHASILNSSDKIRWTAVIKLDGTEKLTHLKESVSPFSIADYIDTRLNSERLKAS